VVQLRDWLPNDIGGLVWLGHDNPATTAYAPVYAGCDHMPESYKLCGRPGFNRKCAWWAFNRVADLAAQKWGHMRHDVAKIYQEFEKEAFEKQNEIEAKALALYNKNPKKARRFLTQYSNSWMNRLVQRYWQLGDQLWSKYTGKF
jgi:dipeptidase